MVSDADTGAGLFRAGLIHKVAAGDRRALARAITLVEGGAEGARRAALTLDWPDRARVIALTGPPGVGKSELANHLAARFAAEGRPVAVLAVDPSSPRTGGALLGDRVRFTGSPDAVFFRSMAVRDGEAGLAPEVPAVLRLLAAGGAERILLETAGVGQGDVSVLELADLGVAVTAPGLGDAGAGGEGRTLRGGRLRGGESGGSFGGGGDGGCIPRPPVRAGAVDLRS